MSLKSIIKKAGMTLGSLALALNMGCGNAKFEEAGPNPGLESRVPNSELIEETAPRKMKKWEYPLNVLGGLYAHCWVHEASHAAVIASLGYEITEAHLLPFFPNRFNRTFTYLIVPEMDENPPDSHLAAIKIAGPLGDICFTECINYNLRNGNVAKRHQPFWATTALINRFFLTRNSLHSINERGNLGNDYSAFAEATDTPPELLAGAIALYTGLSWKRIREEWRTAIGKGSYPGKKGKKASLEVIPTRDGIGLVSRRKF